MFSFTLFCWFGCLYTYTYNREVQFAQNDVVKDPSTTLQLMYKYHEKLSRKRSSFLSKRQNEDEANKQSYKWYGYVSEAVRRARQEKDYKWDEHQFDTDKCKMPRLKRKSQWTKFTEDQLRHFGEVGTVTVKKYKKKDPNINLRKYHEREDGINKSGASELFSNQNSRSKEDLTAVSRIIPTRRPKAKIIVSRN